jgi:hypothetical protein
MKTIFNKIRDKGYVVFGLILKFLFHILSPKIKKDKELSEIKLMMFCGQSGAKMLKPVLTSIYMSWKKMPTVVIVTDGTDPKYTNQFMQFWPYPYTIKTWKEQAEYYAGKDKNGLVKYAENDIWGKKLISILAEAEAAPTLYCDTDVVWFDEPRLPSGRDVSIRMASDDVHCYSEPMIKFFKKEHLMAKGPLNAGVIYVNGSMYEKYEDFEKVVEYLSLHFDNRTEQTTFAMLANEIGDSWSLNDILLTTEDKYWPIIPPYFGKDKNQFARHHVLTKRWWFWRDAIYVILSKKK